MRISRTLVLGIGVLTLGPSLAASPPSSPAPDVDRPDPVATFSILGFDPATGEVGGAVQSRVFSVGNGVLSAEAGVGAVATQASVDVSYGPRGIELLRQGLSPAATVRRLLAEDPDPHPERWPKAGRQFAVMDARGAYVAHTGPQPADAVAVFDAIAGPDPSDPVTAASRDHRAERYSDYLDPGGLRGKRIGVVRQLADAESGDPDVRLRFEEALVHLRAAGSEIVDPVHIAWLDDVPRGERWLKGRPRESPA